MAIDFSGYQPRSEADRITLGVTSESSLGVTPSNPAYQALRLTSSSISGDYDFGTSNEVLQTGENADVFQLRKSVTGSFDFELSYGVLQPIAESWFNNNWSNRASLDNAAQTANPIVSVAATSSGNATITLTGATAGAFASGAIVYLQNFSTAHDGIYVVNANNTATQLVIRTPTNITAISASALSTAKISLVGCVGPTTSFSCTSTGINFGTVNPANFGLTAKTWIKVGGAEANSRVQAAGNNVKVQISAITFSSGSYTATLTYRPSNWSASTVPGGGSLQLFFGDEITNSTLRKSLSFEQIYNQHSPVKYRYYDGVRVNELSLSVASNTLITGSCGIMGLRPTAPSATRRTGANTVAASTNPIMTALNLGHVWVGGVPFAGQTNITNIVEGFTLSHSNNLAGSGGAGSEGYVDIRRGKFVTEGSINFYLDDTSQIEVLENNQYTAFAFAIDAPEGSNGMLIDIPSMKFTTGETGIAGVSESQMFNPSFQARRDNAKGYTMKFVRFNYLPAAA